MVERPSCVSLEQGRQVAQRRTPWLSPDRRQKNRADIQPLVPSSALPHGEGSSNCPGKAVSWETRRWGVSQSRREESKGLGVGEPHKHTSATAWEGGQVEKGNVQGRGDTWERAGEGRGNGVSTQGAERVGEAMGRADTGCPLCCRVGLCAAVLSGLCPKSLLTRPQDPHRAVSAVGPHMDGGLDDHSS